MSRCGCLTGHCQPGYSHKSLIYVSSLTHYSIFNKDIVERLQLFLQLLVRKESVISSVQIPLGLPVLDHWDCLFFQGKNVTLKQNISDEQRGRNKALTTPVGTDWLILLNLESLWLSYCLCSNKHRLICENSFFWSG